MLWPLIFVVVVLFLLLFIRGATGFYCDNCYTCERDVCICIKDDEKTTVLYGTKMTWSYEDKETGETVIHDMSDVNKVNYGERKL